MANIFDTRWRGAHGIGRFASELFQRLDRFASIAIGGRPSSPLDPWMLARYLRSAGPSLFFSPGYNAPFGSPCPFVFCIHDLNHLFVEQNSNALKRAYYTYVMRPAIHRACVVLTVSEFSRHAICEWARVDESRVINVSNGVSAAFKPRSTPERGSADPYFLHVGGHKPHKNLDRILHAFAISMLWREMALVCTGNPTPQLVELIARLGLTDRVRFAGPQSEEELAALYQGALALVFPSLYEGFGLPIVEAMACGTPVLTSTITAMPEVAGDAAVYVDAYQVESIADGLKKLAADPDLRNELRERGIIRAELYSWDATARKTKAALSSCV